jgi:hypothetical protein
MQKWTFFSMGVMAGLILLLGGALLAQGREPTAYAAMQGVDNQGKFIMGIGGSEPSKNDMLWVLHEHKPMATGVRTGDEGDAKVMKNTRMALCLYKITKNGDSMKLIAVRDIAYDIELLEFNQETPKVKEIIDVIRRQMPKEK